MQAQSRLGVSGGGSMSASEDEHEAVVRELTRGRQLTARLRAEALRALRGQGQAEATAALILQEVSRAFTVCLNIMGSPTAGAPPPPEMPGLGAGAAAPSLAPPRRDSIPREQKVTPSPHYDGYQWRKYGQKRITKTHYPRCYYRCSFHRERGCRATKQVQQCGGGDPPQYLVMYFNDHTCDTAAWEPEAAAASAAMRLDMSGAGLLDERGVQEEHERQVLVSSLACVLGAQQQQFHHQSPPAPDAAGSSAAAAAVNVAHQAAEPPQRARTRDAPAPVVDAAAGMPRLDVDVVGLDVMDYDDVPGELCFGDSYGLPGGGDGMPF
ncbi:putative WRKY transcription factor 4 [Panicum miliaceum]|uniref:WRKY transcription factor 4 n=1 Tax=Panicum miliaceum TaxID=4540 RepID=A0A3L6SRZ7_PANMI|nr:putative WRKY transcription factor 4 [Panicum miliaceum]